MSVVTEIEDTETSVEQFPGQFIDRASENGVSSRISEEVGKLSCLTADFLGKYGAFINSPGSTVFAEVPCQLDGLGKLQCYSLSLRVDDEQTVTWQEGCVPVAPETYAERLAIGGMARRWSTAVQLRKKEVINARQVAFKHMGKVADDQPVEVSSFLNRLNGFLTNDGPIHESAIELKNRRDVLDEELDAWIKSELLEGSDTLAERKRHLIENYALFPRTFGGGDSDPSTTQARRLTTILQGMKQASFMPRSPHTFIIPQNNLSEEK